MCIAQAPYRLDLDYINRKQKYTPGTVRSKISSKLIFASCVILRSRVLLGVSSIYVETPPYLRRSTVKCFEYRMPREGETDFHFTVKVPTLSTYAEQTSKKDVRTLGTGIFSTRNAQLKNPRGVGF